MIASLPPRLLKATVGSVRITPSGVGFLSLTVLVAFLVLYPLAMLLFGSVWSARPGFPGTLTLQNYVEAYTDASTYRVLLTTVALMGAKTVIAASVAILLAWIVTRTNTPAKGVLEVLILVPFFVPGILETIGWIMLLSPKAGMLNVWLVGLLGLESAPFNIYSLGGLLWVLSLGSVSFIFLFAVTALRNMDSALEEAGHASGAGTPSVAIRITLPLIAPAILGAAILSFVRAMEAFETPVLIGTPARVFVFTNRIYAAVAYDYPPNYGLATALGVSLIGLTLLLIWFQRALLKGKEFTVVSGKGFRPAEIDIGPFRYPALGLCVLYFLVATALPLSPILLGSVVPRFGVWEHAGFTLENYAVVFGDREIWRSLQNTLLVCGSTALLVTLLGAVIAYVVARTRYVGRHALDTISWIPWTVPGIVAGVGLLWAYIRFPVPVYGTLFLLAIALATTGLPLGVRIMAGVITQIGKELEEVSLVHGANPLTTFRRIMVPLIRPAIAAGTLLLFVTFSRALSPVVLLSGQGTELLSVVLFKYFFAGQLEIVSALAVVLLAINVAGLAVARWLGAFGVREVK